jgi:hypothetical protein
MLRQLEQPPPDQFAFPDPIAGGMETLGLLGDVHYKNFPTSRHGIAAGVAGVSQGAV